MERKQTIQLKLLRPLILFFSEIGSELSKEIEDVDVSYKEFIDQTMKNFLLKL